MKTFFHIWTVPIILSIVTTIGLLSALNGDSIWDVLSWLALAIPLIIGGYFLWLALKKERSQL